MPIAVTVQYPGFEHEERIHELPLGPGLDIVPLLDDPPPRHTNAVSYATELVRRLADDPRPVGLVVAWCMASSIGLEVARLLGDRDGRLPCFIALDGAPCTAEHVADAYQQAMDRYRKEHHPRRPTMNAESLRERPERVIADIRAELTRYASAALLTDTRHADLVAPMVDEVVSVSLDWLIHLIAAHNSENAPWEGEVVIVTSQETPFPGAWPGVAHPRVIPVECAADDLIGTEEVTTLLAGRLSACGTVASQRT